MEPPAERVLRLRQRRAGLVGADSLDLGAGAGGGHRPGGVAPPNFLHAFSLYSWFLDLTPDIVGRRCEGSVASPAQPAQHRTKHMTCPI